jgi:hypothetical protein
MMNPGRTDRGAAIIFLLPLRRSRMRQMSYEMVLLSLGTFALSCNAHMSQANVLMHHVMEAYGGVAV